MAVVREGLDDVGAGALEVDVEAAQGVGEFERDLGHEFSRGEVSALLEFEEEAFRADHGAGVEALSQGVGLCHEFSR